MIDYAEPKEKINSIHYPIGMEINIKVGRGKPKPHRVVEDHRDYVVVNNGFYNFCVSKADLYYSPSVEVDEFEH